MSEWRLNILTHDFELPKTELESAIDTWIYGRNSERNRKILKRRLIDGETFQNLAEEFDLSIQAVQKIVYKNISKIVKHI